MKHRFGSGLLVSAHDSVTESLNGSLREIESRQGKCVGTQQQQMCQSAQQSVFFVTFWNPSFVVMDVYVGKLMSLGAIASEYAMQINMCVGVCACLRAWGLFPTACA